MEPSLSLSSVSGRGRSETTFDQKVKVMYSPTSGFPILCYHFSLLGLRNRSWFCLSAGPDFNVQARVHMPLLDPVVICRSLWVRGLADSSVFLICESDNSVIVIN